MKCLISKSQIRLLFHLVWPSIVFLLLCMLYVSFTWVHQFLRLQGPHTEMFLHIFHLLLTLSFFFSLIFYWLSGNFWLTLPLKRGERIREKKTHTDLLSINRQRLHHQTYFNHNLQFHLSFGKLIFKIWQRQKQIYINYITSTFCKLLQLNYVTGR